MNHAGPAADVNRELKVEREGRGEIRGTREGTKAIETCSFLQAGVKAQCNRTDSQDDINTHTHTHPPDRKSVV